MTTAGSTEGAGGVWVLDDRYELAGVLGEGSMGIVYDGVDQRTDDRVAVKLLRSEFIHHATFRQRFEREAKAAARIRHANVVRIYGFGHAKLPGGGGPYPYIVMELIDGQNLQSLLRRQPRLSAGKCRDLLLQILHGLQAAHALGIIHRDIKPANCMLTRAPAHRVKLLDFGVAKMMDDTSGARGLTAACEVIGTATYLAPELATGAPAHVGSDLYAVAVLGYQLLTGRPPFHGGDRFDIMTRHVRDLPPPLPPSFPADLREVIERGLAKQPRDRFASAIEMADILERPRNRRTPSTAKFPMVRQLSAPGEPGDEDPTLVRVVHAPSRWRSPTPIGGPLAVLVPLLTFIAGFGVWWWLSS